MEATSSTVAGRQAERNSGKLRTSIVGDSDALSMRECDRYLTWNIARGRPQ